MPTRVVSYSATVTNADQAGNPGGSPTSYRITLTPIVDGVNQAPMFGDTPLIAPAATSALFTITKSVTVPAGGTIDATVQLDALSPVPQQNLDAAIMNRYTEPNPVRGDLTGSGGNMGNGFNVA